MKIFIILFAFIVIGYIIYAIANEIKNSKLISAILFSILIGIISLWTSSQRDKEERHAKVLNLFQRNQTITCDDVSINKKEFNFISGTLVFLGKKDTNLQGQIFKLDNCK